MAGGRSRILRPKKSRLDERVIWDANNNPDDVDDSTWELADSSSVRRVAVSAPFPRLSPPNSSRHRKGIPPGPPLTTDRRDRRAAIGRFHKSHPASEPASQRGNLALFAELNNLSERRGERAERMAAENEHSCWLFGRANEPLLSSLSLMPHFLLARDSFGLLCCTKSAKEGEAESRETS